jgi:penicillin-binding protein 2
MIQLPEERRPPMTPQLALRVAILGSFALALFAIVFFRLWFLQVLSGEKYLAQASTNFVRDISIPAPRGEILDRNGNILVDNTTSLEVQISPPDLPVPLDATTAARPPGKDVAIYRRLGAVLGIKMKNQTCTVAGLGVHVLDPIACAVAQQQALLPYANVTVKKYVDQYVQYYVAERQNQFPGVRVQQIYLRRYPLGSLAAQMFGTVGRITAQEVKQKQYRFVSQNSIIGQTGLELHYDDYLRGVDGAERIQVNSLGNFKGYLQQWPTRAGHNLRLSIDVNLQRAGERALQQAIANNPPATAGAFVAMNPDTGEIYAMGSNPTFDPNIFTRPVSESVYKQLNNAASGYPLVNRATQSAYPTGSTFKGITATAALQSGVWNTSDTYDDSGVYSNGPGDTRHNAGHASYGTLDLTQAIKVSSDDFFYNLGRLLNAEPTTHPKGGALQDWARKFGIGQPTGVDTGGESKGILPSPSWRSQNNNRELAYERKHHKPCCTLGDLRPWSVGDNENLAVGQGDLEASPLQLAVAYSALAHHGWVPRPHVGLEVDQSDGTVLRKIDPPPARHINVAPQNLDAILQGLRDAASAPGGTSADVFSSFREQVYGKTGTAERGILANQSWYVCFVPDWATNKPILVVVTVEQGGFGAQAAAPAAREILSQWFFGKPGPWTAGASKTL